MQKKVLVFGLLCMLLPFSRAQAADDFSGDTNVVSEGAFTDSFDSTFKKIRRDTVISKGNITLAKDDSGEYVSSGYIKRNQGILRKHFFYTESASLSMDADLPDGTSIDLYVRTVDPEGSSGVHARSRKWTKVEPGEKVDLESFREHTQGHYSTYTRNNLRWKAVLHTNNPSKTPTLHSITLTYVNAYPKAEQLDILQNKFGVNQQAGAMLKVTVLGKGFQDGKEEVFLKNLYAADSVTFVNSNTLVAEFPIEDLSAGTYTVVVRNAETGRVYKTDNNGAALNYFSSPDPANLRLVLRWFAPEIDSFSPSAISYTNGGTVTITGSYFSHGTRVMIARADRLSENQEIFFPEDSVTVIDEQTIQVDVTSGIITNYGLDRDTNLTILVRTPDYQTTSRDGLYVD